MVPWCLAEFSMVGSKYNSGSSKWYPYLSEGSNQPSTGDLNLSRSISEVPLVSRLQLGCCTHTHSTLLSPRPSKTPYLSIFDPLLHGLSSAASCWIPATWSKHILAVSYHTVGSGISSFEWKVWYRLLQVVLQPFTLSLANSRQLWEKVKLTSDRRLHHFSS